MLGWGHLLRSIHPGTALCVCMLEWECLLRSVHLGAAVCMSVCVEVGASPKKRPPWHSCVCGSICVWCVLGWGRLRSVHLSTAVCVCVCVSVCGDEGISYRSVHLGAVGPTASPGRMGQQFPCSSQSEGASQQKIDSKGLFFLRSL